MIYSVLSEYGKLHDSAYKCSKNLSYVCLVGICKIVRIASNRTDQF